MAGMTFVMLGSGAVRDNPYRGGPAQMLRIGDEVLMFDCGRSASTNLARSGVGCEEVDRLFLTHLHFDHIVDVPYLVFVGWVKVRSRRLKIYGPVGTAEFRGANHPAALSTGHQQPVESRKGHSAA